MSQRAPSRRRVAGLWLESVFLPAVLALTGAGAAPGDPPTTVPTLPATSIPVAPTITVPSPFAATRELLTEGRPAAPEHQVIPAPFRDTGIPLPRTMPPLPPTTGSGPPGASFALTLFPGQVIQPIDLAGILRLAGARNPDIAIARQRVLQAVADLEQARALWLPSLFIGPTYYRADGQVQTVNGPVINVNRSSLFLGTTAASTNGFPGPSPGTGYPQMNGLTSVLRISDAIIEPLAAQRVAAAQQAGLQATANDTLLGVSEAYFNLQLAAGGLAIAREASAYAESLSSITGAYAQTGEGLEADHRRALAEFRRRRREIQAAAGQLKVASSQLIRPLVMDPHLVVAPAEPAETVVRLVGDEIPLDCLIVEGLQHRPELAQAQETVAATVYRLKQAKLRPLVPAIAVTYAGGGFGGGQGGFFGNFGARGDFMASLYWDIRNLGFTDLAICHRRKAENQAADLDLVRVQAQVASDVVSAYEARAAASAQLVEARANVIEAVDSLTLNFTNIRQGSHLGEATRPIEVLQPIQALALARVDYLDAVLTYNRAQFRLYRALGNTPALDASPETILPPPGCSPAVPPQVPAPAPAPQPGTAPAPGSRAIDRSIPVPAPGR